MGLLFLFGILVFSVWMFIDCLTHDVKNKVFWAAIMLVTGPIGAIIYATQRPKLLGENAIVKWTSEGAIEVPATASKSSRVIRNIGMTVGIVLGVGGLLFVGFIILFMSAMSSYGSSK